MKTVPSFLVRSFGPILLLLIMCCSCGPGKNTPKADILELERAFNLPIQTADDSSPSSVASKAVAAIRAKDWVTAVPILNQLRSIKGLTPEQFEAVHNANGNAYVRLVELADAGNPHAQAVLKRQKLQRDIR